MNGHTESGRNYIQCKSIDTFLHLLLIILLASSANAIIVWEGKIVNEWPDQKPLSSLPKSLASGNEGGFYPNPFGKVYALTLLVDFSDQPASFTIDEIRAWLNQPGFNRNGCNGSVKDYFLDVSNGIVELENEVFGFYRATKPKSYYDAGPGYNKASELVAEVLAYFDPQVDYSKYDNDGDGKIDAISIAYTGTGQTWGQGIWPHAGGINENKDNTRLTRYMMTDLGETFRLYVFVHETGHMLFGWPDLYWFGDYCVMGNRMNDYNPVPVNDFFRADQGWIERIDLTNARSGTYKASVNGPGYIYFKPDKPQECFFWSNIRKTGRWSSLRGSGLLIYHFDNSIGGNTGPDKLCLRVMEADGKEDLIKSQWPNPRSQSSDFFFSGNSSRFDLNSTPNSKWYDGTGHLKITDFGPPGDTISFTLDNGETSLYARNPDRIKLSVQNPDFEINNDQLYLRSNTNSLIRIFDISGKLLYTRHFEGAGQHRINFRDITKSTGVFLLDYCSKDLKSKNRLLIK